VARGDLKRRLRPAAAPNAGTAGPEPTDPSRATIKVTWEDVLAGRAYIRLPLVSKLLLLHWAGAPWNQKVPDACLHALQVEVIAHREREKIVEGGSRLGKSVLGGGEAFLETMLPFSQCFVVAQRYDHVGAEWQYVYKAHKALFGAFPQAHLRLVYKHQSAYHDYDVQTIWNARGRGYSVEGDEGAALLGQEATRIVLGEGSHIAKWILEARVMRALDGSLMQSTMGALRECGYLTVYTTPKGEEGCSAAEWERIHAQTKGHPEKLHYGQTDFAGTVWYRLAGVLENPYYDRKVYAARKASLSKAAFEEQYEGLRKARTGRVLKKYDSTTSRFDFTRLRPEDIRGMRLGVGIDTGAYTAFFLAGIDRANHVWGLGEAYAEQVHLDAVLEDYFLPMLIARLGPAFGTEDPAELVERIDLWRSDPASQAKLDLIEKLNIPLADPSGLTGGKFNLIPTLESVDEMFAKRQLTIADGLDVIDREIKRYVWATARQRISGAASAAEAKVPKKSEDHVIDAMRFVVLDLLAAGPLEEPPTRMDFAEAWQKAQKDALLGPLKQGMTAGAQAPSEFY